MKRLLPLLSFATLTVVALTLFGFQTSDKIDAKQLKEMLGQMGYEAKQLSAEVGKEKYSVTITKNSLDIPVSFEISPSGGYVWLTVNLGNNVPSPDKALALLKQNASIQPSFFYVTASGRTMCGLPIDNRGITNVLLRQRMESITDNVGKTQDEWKVKS